MKNFHILLILVYLTFAAILTAAQTPRGVISGTVIYDDGTPAVNANIGLKLKGENDYTRIQTVSPKTDGSFSKTVDAGVYVVIIESRCAYSRTDNVEVLADRTASVNITLVNENCAEKEPKKALEWKACMQEWSVPGLQMSDSEKADVVNQVLEELFRFEDHLIPDNYQEIFFSTANIDPAWIKPFPGVKHSFLTPQQIQARADSSKERIFGYYGFNIQPGSTCAYVGIGMQEAVSKKNPPKKDPNITICREGTSKGYLFRKESGEWKMRRGGGF